MYASWTKTWMTICMTKWVVTRWRTALHFKIILCTALHCTAWQNGWWVCEKTILGLPGSSAPLPCRILYQCFFLLYYILLYQITLNFATYSAVTYVMGLWRLLWNSEGLEICYKTLDIPRVNLWHALTIMRRVHIVYGLYNNNNSSSSSNSSNSVLAQC